jgi:hypothetical protein
MIELAPAFEVLSTPVLPKGSVKAIAAVVSIHYGTIRDWRLKLSADPDWRPYEDRNRHHCTLCEEEERELGKQIHERYIDPGFYYPPKMAQIMARRVHGTSVPEKWAWDGDASSEDGDEAYQDAIETGVTGKKRRKPRKGLFTRRWRAGFIDRNGFSLQRPHLKRRPPVNDELGAEFSEEVDSCFQIDGRDRILNTDETRW